MHLREAEALLLDVVDLHDADRIVSFLTREHGHKRGVARGARRKHSRFAGQLQPLAKARVHWFEKDGRELVRISAVDLLRPAHRMQQDLEGLLVGGYLAGHALEFAQEDEPSEHLYRLLDSTIEALIHGVSRDLAARYFEIWVLRLQGIFPPPRDCPSCGREFGEDGAVLPSNGDALVCPECAGDGRGLLRVRSETLAFLRRCGREGLERLALRPPPEPVLRRVEELCGLLRRRFLHRELRSYEVLKQALPSL
jgi:DNA repair protein RecO (recombination protein O)